MNDSRSRRIADELRRRARDEGFDGVGVARASRLDRDGQALEAWLARDRHAAMAWMARDPDKRADPRRLLPGCRSVVVLAMNYFPGHEAAAVPDGRARVALYARGRDYHKVIGKKLKRLDTWLEAATGSAVRSFVDTGPVLERAWAERAGLGWIGKNSYLLNRESGSWMLLARDPDHGRTRARPGAFIGLLRNLHGLHRGLPDRRHRRPRGRRLQPLHLVLDDRASRSDPGTGACGTGRVDLRLRSVPGRLPVEPQVHRDGAPGRFENREDLRGLDPGEVLAMDEAAFRARYSGTSLMRAKWQGMRRNACVVLGNRRDDAALPVLRRALADVDPVIRSHAEWAVRRIGGARAEEILETMARRDRRAPPRRASPKTPAIRADRDLRRATRNAKIERTYGVESV